MENPKVLIACEESQRVCTAFRERGIEAYSCDIQEPSGGHPEWHILGDVLAVLEGGDIYHHGRTSTQCAKVGLDYCPSTVHISKQCGDEVFQFAGNTGRKSCAAVGRKSEGGSVFHAVRTGKQ